MPSRPSRWRRGRASAFTCLCLASVSCAWAGDLAQSPNLFFIKRNKNANEVHYDARVHDCKWLRPELDSYWRELNRGQDVYAPVKFYEEPAYGFDVDRVSDTEIRISFNALPGRLVTARLVPMSDKGCMVVVGVFLSTERTGHSPTGPHYTMPARNVQRGISIRPRGLGAEKGPRAGRGPGMQGKTTSA